MRVDAIIQSDILVIGAGGAGCRAAIAAAEEGAQTVIACKAPFGRGGCTGIAAGGYGGCITYSGDSWTGYFKDTVLGGGLINNQRLVEILVKEAKTRLHELEEWAAVFNRTEDGGFDLRKFGGHSFPRSAISGDRTGRELMWAVQKKVHMSPLIRIVDEVHITKLFVEEGHVVGAMGVQLLTGKITLFEAAAVIIATGGSGRIFPSSSAGRGNAGDGLRLAYEAGAELVDMEFFQIFPTGNSWPPALRTIHAAISESARSEGARLLNARGERFMEKYDPIHLELATRDYISRCIFTEIRQGRGTEHGGVYLDMRFIPAKRIETVFGSILRRCLLFGIDVRKEPVEVCPLPHYQNGGIKINAWGETGIVGLYACGEVSGGVHGGNRLGSNSLPDLLVFGKRAGERAALSVANLKKRKIPEDHIAAEVNLICRPLGRTDGINPYLLLAELHRSTGEYLQIVRNEKGLHSCLATLESVEKRLDAISVPKSLRYNDPWFTYMELRTRVVVGKMMALASLTRKESRASLYVEEFPEPDRDHWDRNISIQQQNGEMTLSVQPLTVTILDPGEHRLPEFPIPMEKRGAHV
jgi:fumarate reductase (CoM/CoB) subunit A